MPNPLESSPVHRIGAQPSFQTFDSSYLLTKIKTYFDTSTDEAKQLFFKLISKAGTFDEVMEATQYSRAKVDLITVKEFLGKKGRQGVVELNRHLSGAQDNIIIEEPIINPRSTQQTEWLDPNKKTTDKLENIIGTNLPNF